MPISNPFDGKPLRVSVGTRPLDIAQWLQFDAQRMTEMSIKETLLTERHDDVVSHQEDGDEAAGELLELVLEHLAVHEQRRFTVEGPHVHDQERGVTIDTTAWHPIDAAGRLVQEDLTVMTRDAQHTWRLTAASVCFPSRWRLADKIGGDLSQIHGPVPFYEERIGAAVQQLFDRLLPERPLWRMNWTLLDDPALFQPEARSWHTPAQDFGEALFVRVERQTLRALPRTSAIAFTIRTSVQPLKALSAIPGAYGALAESLENTANETVDYKGWTSIRGPLIEWLRSAER